MSEFLEDIKILIEMVKDYFNGTYREIPYRTIKAVVFTLIYVLSPIDIIPDVIPIVGLLDDAFIVGLCLTSIKKDLEQYKEFKNTENKA